MTINQYLKSINNRYKRGNYAEHNLRGDLLNLLETLLPDVQITNETKQLSAAYSFWSYGKRYSYWLY